MHFHKAATYQGDSTEFVPSPCAAVLDPVAARARVSVYKVFLGGRAR
jgi:hypothetical protein